jgi:hypothetical protein
MPQSQPLPFVVPFAAIGRPSCPKCKAAMMLVSIELAGPGVDLHTFECAICNHVLETRAAYEDPMKSKGLGRWFQGGLHPPKARRAVSEPAASPYSRKGAGAGGPEPNLCSVALGFEIP